MTAARLMAIGLGLLLVLPALLFLGAALYAGMGLGGGLQALWAQYGAERSNLGVVTLLGLVPWVLIGGLLGLRRLLRGHWHGSDRYAAGALVPVLAVTVVMHLEYWPRFLPARRFLGFPHGLEFVLGPLVYAPAGALLGCLVVWLLARWRR